jgi:hypothetical protein
MSTETCGAATGASHPPSATGAVDFNKMLSQSIQIKIDT